MRPINQRARAIKRLVSLIDAHTATQDWINRCDPFTLGGNGRVYLENRLRKTLHEGVRIGQMLAREGYGLDQSDQPS